MLLQSSSVQTWSKWVHFKFITVTECVINLTLWYNVWYKQYIQLIFLNVHGSY